MDHTYLSIYLGGAQPARRRARHRAWEALGHGGHSYACPGVKRWPHGGHPGRLVKVSLAKT
eukprot:scaffold72327_cov61-Phaeocystis_antarctica.AAC.5